jgi:tetratricopeptide (TPR) repeat protein
MPNMPPLGWSLILLIPCCVATFTGAASAREIGDDGAADTEIAAAEQKAAQAFQAYRERRFGEAVALYLEAYRAAPSADILYNVARIYDAKLGDRPLAISFYRRYIADPGAISDRIQIANERLVTLRDAELAATRPSPAAQGAPESGAAVPASGAPAQGAASAGSGWNGAEVTGVLLGATGIVALGVGAGFGLAALQERETMRDLCEGNVCSEQRGIDSAASASDHATVSTIAFASGGALLALGAAFYFWLGDEPSESRGQASDTTDTRLRLGAGATAGGLSLELGGAW